MCLHNFSVSSPFSELQVLHYPSSSYLIVNGNLLINNLVENKLLMLSAK